jgi:hypothetical protein
MKNRQRMRWLAPAAALLALASPAAGQLSNPSASALGLADNFTAAARGYAALAWNPAGLGLSGGSTMSATLGSTRVITGLGPVTLTDLAGVEGEVVPESVRRQWLADIARAGGQTGAAGFDFVWGSVQFGRVAAQFSTTGRALASISPGMAELLLIGNVGEDGSPRTIEAGGSFLDMNLYSTAAIGYGLPIPVGEDRRLALGVTGKYTVGHTMALSGESGGRTTGDPLGVEFAFPLVYSPVVREEEATQYRSGGGFSLDVGAGFEAGRWTVAAVVQNVVTTFAWDVDRLRYRATELEARNGQVESSFDAQPVSAAPQSLRQAVEDYTFQPNYAAGALYRWSRALLVSADARFGSTDGLATRPSGHVGAGLEYRLLPWLPVQVGAAHVRLRDQREGVQFGGGLRLELGSFDVSGSAARRNVGEAGETLIMLTLLSHRF